MVPIWIKLPGLPRQYWTEEHFINIGNILGTFREADLSITIMKVCRVTRILVNINIREGLGEDIQLSWRGVNFTQKLDYENVSFRCRRCHAYGHPAADCNSGIRTINADHI